MRITYDGTLLEQILIENKCKPIACVHVCLTEFEEIRVEAEQKGILDSYCDTWLSLKNDITIYPDKYEDSSVQW